ncbi:hypothetical protein SAMN04488103_103312 [Gemmobacter aquatilis]|uniref:Uncharacterized protein n=1 Tax=Gemmobacter aquatilis TaxID=933059 RepID=A0A1H8EGJ1_9RHOB|nr:hypothetical protein [Gemmobacter aquatilis]SEN18526.1 hypothetical protein SAMN04488103_103312 [Gemmobacter aquatilis]
MRWRVDGGAWTTLPVQGAVDTIQSAVLPLTAGAHTVEIEVVSGTVKLCGDKALSDAPGYRCHKIARSGSRVRQWIAQDKAQQRAAWQMLGVNVWTYMEATNSQTTPGETAPAAWRDMMRTMVARMRAASQAVRQWGAAHGVQADALRADALSQALERAARLALDRKLTGDAALNLMLGYASEALPDAIAALGASEAALRNRAAAELLKASPPKIGM